MKIQSVLLKGFKAFQFADIQNFEAEFIKPITIVMGSNGSGKMSRNTAQIKVPYGQKWKLMGDVQVGDLLTMPDGSVADVSHVFPQGLQYIYRVHFKDGRYTDCGAEHLWSVHVEFRPPHERIVASTKELMRHFQTSSKRLHIDYIRPESKTTEPDKVFPIHPYLLGVLIGDGGLTSGVIIHSDKWIIDKCFTLLPQGHLIRTTHEKDKIDYYHSGSIQFDKQDPPKRHIKLLLRDLGLLGTRSYEKFIPEEYFNGSWEQRMQLLQGLMDTDGYVSIPGIGRNGKRGNMGSTSYCTSSERLHNDIKRLIWSLGGTAHVQHKSPWFTYKGERKQGRPAFNIHIRIRTPGDLFTLPRKRERMPTDGENQYTEYHKLRIVSVEFLNEKDECTCIRVNHPEQLYICDDYIVTHNSSLLRELTPIPAIRTDYDKDGYKSLVVEHENETYTLTSDFTNRSAPHSFKCGDKELNVSGVTQVQTELVQKHFGYSPHIHDLVYMSTDLCRMGPAERKNFFLAINPVDLKHILDQHKRVSSRIKEYKSNLSMLHARRTEIESKLMTKEMLNATYLNKDVLVEQASILDKMIYALAQHISKLKETHTDEISKYRSSGMSTESFIPTDRVKVFHRNITQFLMKYKDIPKESYDTELYELAIDIQKYTFSLQEYERTANDIKKEIDEYHTHLDATTTKATSNMEAALKEITEVIKQTTVSDDILKLSAADIEDAEKVLHGNFKEQCLLFLHKPSTVWSPEQARKCYTTYDHVNNTVGQWSRRLQDIEKILAELRQEHASLLATVPKECVLDTCVLKKTHVAKRAVIQSRMTELERESESIEKKQVRYLKVQERFGELCKEQMLFSKAFDEMLILRNRHPSLYRVFTTQSLFDILTTNPTQVMRLVEDVIINSKNTIILTEHKEKEQLLRKELEVMVKSNTSSVEFLNNILREKTIQLTKVLQDLSDTEKKYVSATERIRTLRQFKTYKEELSVLQQLVETNGKVLIAIKSIEFHYDLLKICEKLKSDIQEQLRTIETTIKEQESLWARYDEEIVKWIQKIDTEKWKYELIEKALSPSNGIPHRYMVTYINNLIHNVNYFISQVFSYKMTIVPVNEDVALDFIFPVELEGGTLVRDISRLSKGQKEMVSIAWVFAILLQTKQLDKFCLFLDEVGSGFDPYHSQKLIEFLRDMVDRKILSQIFVVNHEALVASGFSDGDVIVLRTENVLLPEVYNEHVTMQS